MLEMLIKFLGLILSGLSHAIDFYLLKGLLGKIEEGGITRLLGIIVALIVVIAMGVVLIP